MSRRPQAGAARAPHRDRQTAFAAMRGRARAEGAAGRAPRPGAPGPAARARRICRRMRGSSSRTSPTNGSVLGPRIAAAEAQLVKAGADEAGMPQADGGALGRPGSSPGVSGARSGRSATLPHRARLFAAWLGLTPRNHTTATKQRLGRDHESGRHGLWAGSRLRRRRRSSGRWGPARFRAGLQRRAARRPGRRRSCPSTRSGSEEMDRRVALEANQRVDAGDHLGGILPSALSLRDRTERRLSSRRRRGVSGRPQRPFTRRPAAPAPPGAPETPPPPAHPGLTGDGQ